MDLVFAPGEIETWPIEHLRPYAGNAKMHGDDQVARIAASMAKFGWTVPCMVADDGELIAGHGRVLAATMLGLSEVPVIRLGHLDEAERRAYRIADNKLTEMGDWDEAVLRDEIAGLLAEDFDLTLLGMADEDLDALLQDPDAIGDGKIEGEDDVPETPEDPVSQRGDLWALGNHRLLCGDATVATDVERLFGPVKPLLMVTDPPYGVEYDPSWRNHAGAAKTKRTGKVLNDDRADWREAWALFPGDVAYVWHGALHAATVAESLIAAGFNVRSQIIWAKDRLVLSRGDYHWQHEPCWYAVRKSGKGHWSGDRKQTTLWQITGKDQDVDTVHGTQKPVECMRRPILNNSSPGQAIYEPFMGSGTTLIAADTTGRVCLGIELNPVYVDVAVQRWQQFTGEAAVLAETEETFADLKVEKKRGVKQSRAMSFVEAIANVVVGYSIAVVTQALVFAWFGLQTTQAQNLQLAAAFTLISIIRSFALRRLFEAIRSRRGKRQAAARAKRRRQSPVVFRREFCKPARARRSFPN